jgi:hypothetical protein
MLAKIVALWNLALKRSDLLRVVNFCFGFGNIRFNPITFSAFLATLSDFRLLLEGYIKYGENIYMVKWTEFIMLDNN